MGCSNAWGVLGEFFKERNNRVFESKNRRCSEVMNSIIREMGSWLMVTKEFKELSWSMLTNDWVTSISLNTIQVNKVFMECKRPSVIALKLNFDGFSIGNLGLGGFGCVIRDCNGTIIQAICGPLGVCNSLKAEALGLLFGLHELKPMGVMACCVLGDSNVVIG